MNKVIILKKMYDNKVFRSTILHHRKKLNIHASNADLLHTVLE